MYLLTYNGLPSELNKMSVIEYPDNMGVACNFIPSSIDMLMDWGGATPNYPNYRLGAASPNYCDSLLQLAVAPPQEKEEIHFYPNPTSTKITLEYSKIYQGGKAEIFNLLGEK